MPDEIMDLIETVFYTNEEDVNWKDEKFKEELNNDPDE